jgi:hypothetical protein
VTIFFNFRALGWLKFYGVGLCVSILFHISVLLDVQANLPETSPFFVYPNGFGEHLFSNVYSTWYV